MSEQVERTRPAVEVKVAAGQYRFDDVMVEKALYATGWDGSVVLRAAADGGFGVVTER